MTYTKLTQEDLQDIRQMLEQHKEISAIAEWIGCDNSLIYYYRHKWGFSQQNKPRWTPADDVTLLQGLEQGEELTTIAEKLGRSRMAVQLRMTTMRIRGIKIPYRYKRSSKRKEVTDGLGCRV